MNVINGLNVANFIDGYVTAMLWSSSDEEGANLDSLYSYSDFSPEAVDRVEADCRSFLYSASPWIKDEHFTGRADGSLEQRAGHDFWLTRAGHGAGFWDGDWSTVGDILTAKAKAFANLDPYVGDDDLVHL